MNNFNPTQALMSLALLITFVSVYTWVHLFSIKVVPVNMFVFNVINLVNSCNVFVH